MSDDEPITHEKLLLRTLAAGDAGDKDSIKSLLEQATDELNAKQSISDYGLALFLVEYLTDHIKSLPRSRAGRPSKFEEQFDIAIRVEICRLPASNNDSPDAIRGVTLEKAITHVAKNSEYAESTVETYHESHRQAALTWIEQFGPRLANRDKTG
jgi:hypothetical protein